MKILILTIATNKYIQFVERLYDNIEDKFLNGHEIQGLLFTEHDVETSDNIKVSQIEHEDWPMPTLKRYNYFIKEKEYILETGLVADLSIVKAWKGDEAGNLIFRKTARNFNPVMATAGKITVVEVEELVSVGELDPDQIHTPGIYVQRIIQGSNYSKAIENLTTREKNELE